MAFTRWLKYAILLSWIAILAKSATENTVFMAHRTNLVSLSTSEASGVIHTETILPASVEAQAFSQVEGLDCDAEKQMLCWTDITHRVVRCSDSKPTEKCAGNSKNLHISSVVVGKGQPQGVALDPCHMMLYWTDKVLSTIGVVRLKRNELNEISPGVSKDILTSENELKEPTAIAVDSCAGYIFFTDVGASVQRVAKATTDGSNVEVLAPKSPRNQLFTSPTALALNRKTKTVIFADSEGAVFTIGYDGSNIRRITKTDAVHDLALGCGYRQLFLSTSSPNPITMNLVGGSKKRIPMNSIGDKVYYGACSYCDNCQCGNQATSCSSDNGGCSHFCFEQRSKSSKCACPPGYILDSVNQKQCQVETPQLLVANGKKLMSLHPDGSGSIQGKDVDLSVGLLSNMYALDYVDINGRQSVVYTDQGAVKRRSLDGSDEAIITNGIPGLRGIAVDCTTGNIYYSDIQKGTITVSNFEGTAQRVCYASISRPFTIALNTKKGELYFSSIGSKSIFRSRMDCSGIPTSMVNVGLASGLALDESAQILYWTEHGLGQVHSYNIERGLSSQIPVIDYFSTLKRPFDLTLSGGYLYFTDWVSRCVGSIPTSGGRLQRMWKSCNRGQAFNGITSVRKQCKISKDSCSDCEEPRMCMLSSGNSFTCRCPGGFNEIGRKCELPKEDFILVSARHSIMALSLSGKSGWIARLPLPPQQNIIAIDYEYSSNTVFWTDVKSKEIFSANLDGTNKKRLLRHDPNRPVCRLCVPDGLVYDWKSRRLYYTDAEAGEICYIDLNSNKGKAGRVLAGLDKPRAIVINQDKRKLYFTEWGSNPRISSVAIPQRGELVAPQVLLSQNLMWPNALVLSKDRSKMYFGEAGLDYVASYDFASGHVTRLSNAPHVFGMDVHAEYLYWSDWASGVSKIPVAGGNVKQLATTTDVFRASGIKVFTSQE